MKLFAFGCRDFDEEPFFLDCSKELGVELGYTSKQISPETLELARGYDCISILTNPVTADMIDRLKDMGVRMISTRTIGYDHVDYEYAEKVGMYVSNVAYTPECVADFAVMLMLMSLRKMKRIMQRGEINDFTLKGNNGGIMCERTVGVIGTGRIGRCVIRDLQGFGCKVYYTDPCRVYIPGGEYLPQDELLERCDIISLHAPLTDDTFHMIDAAAIERMPRGVIIVNTARGALIDSDALISALESGKVGACGLDVVEDEFNMYYFDRRSDVLGNRRLSILRDMPNVIVAPHMAFYTDRSVYDMVSNSVLSCLKRLGGEEDPWKVC